MELTTQTDRKRKLQKQVSYTNRMGQVYFAHQGLSKTGTPKYFASKKSDGAMMKLPKGFVFGENINGVVTLQRQKSPLVPKPDINLVRQTVAAFRHLKQYRVEAKDKSILIYEPMGTNFTLEEMAAPSMFDCLKAMLGDKFDDALATTAKNMGITVRELKRIDKLAAEKKCKERTAHLIRHIQYDPIMRFTLDPICGSYRVERRCYRGEERWALLGFGALSKMLKKYVRHIGKESFFNLV